VSEQFEEIRAARDASEKANRAKTEFLALVSHEVRTPMNGILAMSELAIATRDDAERRECLGLVRSSTESLLHVLRDILDFSSMEEGSTTILTEPFAAGESLADAARLYEALARKKGLAFDIEVDVPRGLTLIGDSGRLRQLVTNLVDNAIKYTESGHVKVMIGADPIDEKECLLSLSVEDSGIGIEQDKLRLIFEPFTQAESFLKRSYGGTGLGLAAAKRLVERMGGRIWAESGAGAGSSFNVELTLPIAPPEKGRVDVLGKQSEQIFRPDLRVLVAEDNLVNQRVAEKMLTREGLSVTLVPNGQEAVEACAAKRFDLVLMDLQMPVMDGLEATRTILAAAADSEHAPTIIALTAHGTARDVEECRAAGMVDVLTKPISRDHLVGTLRRHFGDWKAGDGERWGAPVEESEPARKS
jgi:CheY-like chemotaxis protein